MADTADRLVYTIEVKDIASKPLEAIKKQLQGFDTAVARMVKEFEKMNSLDLTGFQNLARTLDPLLRQMEAAAPAFAQASKGLSSIAKETKEVAEEATKTTTRWETWSKKIVAAIAEAGKALLDFGLNIAKKAFEGLIALVSKAAEGIKDFVADSVRAYADFEEQLGGARKTMGLTNEETEALGKRIRELSLDFSDTGLAAGVAHKDLAEIAELAGQMNISFEENSKDFDTFIKTVAMATGAFKMGAEETATALGQLKNNFRLTMDELPAVAGAIDIVGNASLANEPKIMQFATSVGTMAYDMGLTAEDMIAFGGVFGDAGVDMNVASTAMTQTFLMLRTELDKFAEVLAPGGITKEMLEFKVRSGDMAGAIMLVSEGLARIGEKDALAADQALKDLGFEGKRALQAFYALKNGQEDFVRYQEMIKDPINNSTSLLESYRAALDGMNARFKQAGVVIKDVQMTIGEKLANAIESVMENNIIPLLAKIQEWIQQSPVAKALFEEMGKVITWVGEQVGILGERFLTWLQSLDSTQAADNVTKWLKEMGSEVAKFWESLRDTDWKQVWAELQGVLSNINSLIELILPSTRQASAEWAAIKQIFEQVWGIITKVYDIYKKFYDAVVSPVLTGYFETLINIINEVKDALAAMTEWWVKIGDSATGFLEKTKLIGDAIDAVFSGALNAVKEVATFIGDGMTGGALSKLIDKLKEVGIVSHEKSVFPDMAMWAGKAADAIGGISAQTMGLADSIALTGRETGQLATMMNNALNNPLYLTQLENARRAYYRMTGQAYPSDIPAPGESFSPVGANIPGGMSGGNPYQSQGFGSGGGGAGGGGMMGGNAPTTVLPSTGGQTGGGTYQITINAGANLVDDYALGQFALQIQQQIEQNATRTIRTF